MKFIVKIFALAVMLVSLTACFKDEKQGTLMRITVHIQNDSEEEVRPATADIETYAFHTQKGETWEVLSWEDALEHRITEKNKPSNTRTTPDVYGTFDGESEYQVALQLTSKYEMLVLVDHANKMFAYRNYETPINIPETFTSLHLYAWRKSGTANGWTTVNPFPDEDRTPDEETTEDGNDGNTEDQITE